MNFCCENLRRVYAEQARAGHAAFFGVYVGPRKGACSLLMWRNTLTLELGLLTEMPTNSDCQIVETVLSEMATLRAMPRPVLAAGVQGNSFSPETF